MVIETMAQEGNPAAGCDCGRAGGKGAGGGMEGGVGGDGGGDGLGMEGGVGGDGSGDGLGHGLIEGTLPRAHTIPPTTSISCTSSTIRSKMLEWKTGQMDAARANGTSSTIRSKMLEWKTGQIDAARANGKSAWAGKVSREIDPLVMGHAAREIEMCTHIVRTDTAVNQSDKATSNR